MFHACEPSLEQRCKKQKQKHEQPAQHSSTYVLLWRGSSSRDAPSPYDVELELHLLGEVADGRNGNGLALARHRRVGKLFFFHIFLRPTKDGAGENNKKNKKRTRAGKEGKTETENHSRIKRRASQRCPPRTNGIVRAFFLFFSGVIDTECN